MVQPRFTTGWLRGIVDPVATVDREHPAVPLAMTKSPYL
jgi:hypothetical protein